MMPDIQTLYGVVDATWPPASTAQVGPFTIRDGQNGGQRVSAATTTRLPVTADEVTAAESAMIALNQPRLFMIREGQDSLDDMLSARGYPIVDPVNFWAAPIDSIATDRPTHATTFSIWPPLAIQTDFWAEGGIGPGRINVMRRAPQPKTTLLGRIGQAAAATGFVAIHDGIAMIHALEVRTNHRRAGAGRALTRHAAFWARDHGASHLAVLCTSANDSANGLYSSLGMTLVGSYHYRKLEG